MENFSCFSINSDHNPEHLFQENIELKKQLQILINEISYKEEIIKLFQRQIYLAKSERQKEEELGLVQGSFFNEFEEINNKNPDFEQIDLIDVESHTRKKPVRKPLSKDLPRKEIIIELLSEERVCSYDGSVLKEIGEVVSEQIDIIPQSILVIKTIRKKYACSSCDQTIKTAKMPELAMPKSLASAGALAFIVTSKYVDHLPLYRQEKIFERIGIEIPRNTMASWMIRSGELVQPLINLIQEEIVSSNYVGADETRVQVLKEDGRRPEAKSWMWIMASEEKKLVTFNYEKTRSGKVPQKLLQEFSGHLQVDGYGGYNEVCKKKEVIRVGCMAHVKRKFIEAEKVGSFKNIGKHGKGFIGALYKIENEAKGLAPDEVKKARQLKSKIILEKFKIWIEEKIHKTPPQSTAGKALLYTRNEWENITRFIEDGNLRLDNNVTENLIRPFAVGRKNWLFSDTEKGAESSSNLYTLVVSAKMNNLDPYKYLRKVFEDLPRAKTLADFEALLPNKLKLPE